MWYAAVTLIFLFAGFERFYRISEIGMQDNDGFFYYQMALEYLNGNIFPSEHFRPLAYWFYARALQLGGVNMHSIKILNSIFDMLNLLLILVLGKIILRNRWWALVPLALYAALVPPVYNARSELLHVPATLPLLVSAILMTLALQNWNLQKGLVLVFVSGIFLGTSGNFHPTMNLLGPLFVAGIFAYQFRRQVAENFIFQALKRSALFTFGFFVPYLCVATIMGAKATIESLRKNQGAQTTSEMGFLGDLQWSLVHFISDNSSWLATIVIFTAVAAWLLTRTPRRQNFIFSFFAIVCFGYILLYVILVPKYLLARSFLPLMPILIILVVGIFKYLSEHWRPGKIVAAVLAVACAISLRPSPQAWAISVFQPTSTYFAIYRVLKPALKHKERILVLPLVAFMYRRPLSQNFYFGNQADYVLYSDAKNADEILRSSEYHWLVLQKNSLDHRIPKWDLMGKREFEKRLTKFTGIPLDQYSYQKELEFWRATATKYGYQVFSEDDSAVIYEKVP